MVDRPSWAPGDLALDEPSIARIWDWFLGGSHNFAADREVARRTLELMPEVPRLAQISRAFLRRSVRYCLDAGVGQFLDLGSGIPTVGNVHEVAQEADPRARVVYVDRDDVAVAHTRQILAGSVNTGVVQADLREPRHILESAAVRGLLDLSEPVAVLLISVLHFVGDDEDPVGIVGQFHDALAPGSMVAIAHGSRDTEDMPPGRMRSATEAYERSVAPVTLRSRDEVTALFAGFEPVAPGVVWLPQWHPEPEPQAPAQAGARGQSRAHAANGAPTPRAGYGGVGVKR